MKIINNYDLIEKVNDSKGKIDLLKIILVAMTLAAPSSALVVLLNLSSGLIGLLKTTPMTFGLAHYFITIALATAAKVYTNKSKRNLFSQQAEKDLLILMNELRESGVKTDLELLKESREDLVEYKFISEAAKLKLRENKYILVPAHDGFGGTKDVPVLQEHNVGSKFYVLSLGNTKKCLKPVRVYN
jgi:hypothetical protein